VAIIIPNKADFREKNTIRDKKKLLYNNKCRSLSSDELTCTNNRTSAWNKTSQNCKEK
jgi:hypothetical protein